MALWPLKEHNLALEETLAPQIDASKEQDKVYNSTLELLAAQIVDLSFYQYAVLRI